MNCSLCKSELRIGSSVVVEKDGKTVRILKYICANKACPNYGKVLAEKEIEENGND